MPRTQNQDDIVRMNMGVQSTTETSRIRVPGIETLHEKPTDEIAEALALVLKSRSGVTEVRYVIGEYIELTHSV